MDASPQGKDGRSYKELFKLRPQNIFLVGVQISYFGSLLVPLALAFAVLQETDSVFLLGLSLALIRLPQAVVTLVGGVLGDNIAPRRVVLWAASASVLLNLISTVALLSLSGFLAAAVLVALQIVASSLAVFTGPPLARMLQTLYEDSEYLDAAVSFNASFRSLAQVFAQGLAGLMVFVGSPALCFLINALTFVALILGVAKNFRPSAKLNIQEPSDRATFTDHFGYGLKVLAKDRQFSLVIVHQALLWLLTIQPFLILTPALLHQTTPTASVIWGAVGVFMGLGGILGGWIGGRLTVSDPLTFAVFLALLDIPVFTLLVFDPGSPVLYVVAALSGTQSTLARVEIQQQLYHRFSNDVLSRVQSFLGAAWLLPAFVASLAVPLIADSIGLQGTLGALVATASVATILLGIRVRANRSPGRPSFPNLPEEPEGEGS